ncbi:unnamed protein product [Chondrus crispus]|uniref:Uncharacterized protein n=1 Tax=Chondrus crispus TaxID=2769 RepID=R7QGS6_CHOCR|nr:unnamed protein product [Chondrus crispus]CDF37722.1 unnamed protein product [Chondrus crispus]|eukprot:XP_005717593.1 unnamed protein product [Chondrus crispus]
MTATSTKISNFFVLRRNSSHYTSIKDQALKHSALYVQYKNKNKKRNAISFFMLLGAPKSEQEKSISSRRPSLTQNRLSLQMSIQAQIKIGLPQCLCESTHQSQPPTLLIPSAQVRSHSPELQPQAH